MHLFYHRWLRFTHGCLNLTFPVLNLTHAGELDTKCTVLSLPIRSIFPVSLSSLIFRITALELIFKRSLISLAVILWSCLINETFLSYKSPWQAKLVCFKLIFFRCFPNLCNLPIKSCCRLLKAFCFYLGTSSNSFYFLVNLNQA